MKNLIYPFLIVLAFLAQSCETDIPVTDTTPPEFTFRITGDGISYTFTQNDDYENIILNLKNGATYEFFYTGFDDGGVQTIQWKIPPSDYIEFGTTINSPWTIRESPSSKIIEWQGDINNPITGNIIAGNFEAHGEAVRVNFYFFVRNFSGVNASNAVSKRLRLNIDNHNSTEIVEFLNQ